MQLFDSLTQIMIQTVLMIKSSHISFYILWLYSFCFGYWSQQSLFYTFYVNFLMFWIWIFLYFNIYFNPEDTFLIVFRKRQHGLLRCNPAAIVS